MFCLEQLDGKKGWIWGYKHWSVLQLCCWGGVVHEQNLAPTSKLQIRHFLGYIYVIGVQDLKHGQSR